MYNEWYCGIHGSLARGIHVHSPAINKQFSAVHIDTPGLTFVLICVTDDEKSATAALIIQHFSELLY